MMQPLDLINVHIRLEYALDAERRLVTFPGSSKQALNIVYHHAGGTLHFFNHRLPLELRLCEK